MTSPLSGHEQAQDLPPLGNISCELPPSFNHPIPQSENIPPYISAINSLLPQTQPHLQQHSSRIFLPQYDWENKWLKGDEYALMLHRIDEYCQLNNLQKYPRKTHPEDIYHQPQNGLVYFVEGNCVGSEFGFPRVLFRKQYRWKKMNFTTDLPKKHPQVTYIVASSVKCTKKQSTSEKATTDDVYRMHAVILYQQEQSKQLLSSANSPQQSAPKQYILCHIRKIDVLAETERSVMTMPRSVSHEKNSQERKLNGEDDNENNSDFLERKIQKKLKCDILEQKDHKETNENNINSSSAPSINSLILKDIQCAIQQPFSFYSSLLGQQAPLKQSTPETAIQSQQNDSKQQQQPIYSSTSSSHEHSPTHALLSNDSQKKTLSFQATRSSRKLSPFSQTSHIAKNFNTLSNSSSTHNNNILDSSQPSNCSDNTGNFTFNTMLPSQGSYLASPQSILPSAGLFLDPSFLNSSNTQLLAWILEKQQEQQQQQQQQCQILMQQLATYGDMNDLVLSLMSKQPSLAQIAGQQGINYPNTLAFGQNINLQAINSISEFLLQNNSNNTNTNTNVNTNQL